MNITTDKSYKNFLYLSRYNGVPVFFNTLDDKFFSGITSWLKTDTGFKYHTVEYADSLDSLALKYYGNPTYYWIIADFNRILDPYMELKVGSKIKIPEFSNIEFNY